MYFIDQIYSSTLEIKRSKFITWLCPYNKFDEVMKKLKLEHPKGRHFVYAYRYLNQFDQIVENSSDDGEPKGTSGKPSLQVITGNEMINSAVIIVRYFGGIRLGTGGLVRAYSDAVNQVIQNAHLLKYVKQTTRTLTINYSMLSQVEYLIGSFEITIEKKEFTNDVTLFLKGSVSEFEKLQDQLFLGCELIES